MHEQIKCHDACPNPVQLIFKLSSNSQNWLEHKVSNKNPKILKKPLEKFVINLPIDHRYLFSLMCDVQFVNFLQIDQVVFQILGFFC